MSVEAFNGVSAGEARALVAPCLAVPRWVDEVVSARPYVDLAALLVQAEASAQNLSDEELEAALAQHPRIGERPSGGGAEAAFSQQEQGGVATVDAVAERLQVGNAAYEARFGRVFLIRAADRSAEEILEQLERRLGNDDEHERREVVTQLRQIALLRLEQVVVP